MAVIDPTAEALSQAIKSLEDVVVVKIAGLQQAVNKVVEKVTYQEARLMGENQSERETERLVKQHTDGEAHQLAENTWTQKLRKKCAELVHDMSHILEDEEYELWKTTSELEDEQFNKKGIQLHHAGLAAVWYNRASSAHKNGEPAEVVAQAFKQQKDAETEQIEKEEAWIAAIDEFEKSEKQFADKMKGKEWVLKRWNKEVSLMTYAIHQYFEEEAVRAQEAGVKSSWTLAHEKIEEVEEHRVRLSSAAEHFHMQ